MTTFALSHLYQYGFKKYKTIIIMYAEQSFLVIYAIIWCVSTLIFWLKNRKPTKWKDKIEQENENNNNNLNNAKEILVKIKEVAKNDRNN